MNQSNEPEGNSWHEWARYVLENIKEIKLDLKETKGVMYAKMDELKDDINSLVTSFESQKIRTNRLSAFYGIIGGAIPVIIVLVSWLILKGAAK